MRREKRITELCSLVSRPQWCSLRHSHEWKPALSHQFGLFHRVMRPIETVNQFVTAKFLSSKPGTNRLNQYRSQKEKNWPRNRAKFSETPTKSYSQLKSSILSPVPIGDRSNCRDTILESKINTHTHTRDRKSKLTIQSSKRDSHWDARSSVVDCLLCGGQNVPEIQQCLPNTATGYSLIKGNSCSRIEEEKKLTRAERLSKKQPV